MATLGVLDILISVKDGDVQSQLSKTEKATKNWGNKLSAWTVAKGQMIGNFATKAITTVGNAMKDTVKAAFTNFAEYEQLVGGVDTLFKKSSQRVQDYASKAYLNVGISANKYMETVTSFSASLLQSLGGDTEKAADVSNMAMIDMADNMNKMGSSMESIENAYKGFAKQNYTMLDNLKLGYGGTNKEMKRLLDDASKLTGKKYDIKNLSDVYEAIHAIQEEMGIAGTTQKEAMSTVSGSMNAAKAAWQDVLTSIGRGKDIKKTIKNFANTAKVALKNAAPVVRQAVTGLFQAAKDLAPEIGNIINEVGRGLFGKDWDITINWIQNAWTDVSNAFNTAVEWVGNAYQVTVEWIQNAWNTVSDAFTSAADWINKTVTATVEWVNNAWDTTKSAFDEAGKWVDKAFNTTVNWIRGTWEDVSDAITKAAVDTYDSVVNFTLGIVKGVQDFIASIPKAIDVVVNFVKGAVTSVTNDSGTFQGGESSGLGWGETFDVPSVEGWGYNAKGNWNVPHEMYTRVHRGETILNASQARRYREGHGNGVEDLAYIVAASVNKAMSLVNVLMSGDKVGDITTKRVNKNINASNRSRVRAYGGA